MYVVAFAEMVFKINAVAVTADGTSNVGGFCVVRKLKRSCISAADSALS